jgi:NAD(P)-dependent dehydrogenase (short-subunit alcohol dehydrogenase family)
MTIPSETVPTHVIPKRPTGTVQYDHAGRVVLITGGCHGIGRAIVDGFAAANATVLCLDIDQSAASQLPAGVYFEPLDVANEAECARVIQHVVEELGGLDVLVNNAAIQPPESYVRLEDVRAEDAERMLSINWLGYMNMAKHAVRVMRQQQCGVIVNIASGQAHRTTRGVPVYGPIKAANVLQAMQWGIEYARDGVRVVSVSPGAIDTPLVRASLAAQGGEARLANRHPLGRIGQPSEIAHAVLWLSSSAASFITATDLSVDGGLQAFGAFAEPFESPSTTQ